MADLPFEYPMFFTRAKGSHVFDVDGNEYVDYLSGQGSIILGHCNREVQQAVRVQLSKAEMFGANFDDEVKLSEKITEHVPCAEQVILTNAGTLADFLAIRLAKSYSRREKVLKFGGHYHGYLDWTFFEQIPPDDWLSAGISKQAAKETVILPWNDERALEEFLSKNGNEIGAVICEPISFNTCGMMPEPGFLETLRKLTKEYGIVLIFDEVITGFRLGLGGFQEKFGVVPDLATFAKAMGNGYPIGAVAGRKEIMETETFYGGTFNSHPLSVVASLATIRQLEKATSFERIYKTGRKLIRGLRDGIQDAKVDAIVQGLEPCFNITFTELKKIKNKQDAIKSATPINEKRATIFFQSIVRRGILNLPKNGIRWHINLAQNSEDVDKTIEVAEEALKLAKKQSA
jgi:glutamate-1-semialdehyde 2,1-aminomutase